jgi:hypothetical protein
MTISNGGIRLVELEILMVMLGQKDNGKSKVKHEMLRFLNKNSYANALPLFLAATTTTSME